jgi:hypothetical protein
MANVRGSSGTFAPDGHYTQRYTQARRTTPKPKFDLSVRCSLQVFNDRFMRAVSRWRRIAGRMIRPSAPLSVVSEADRSSARRRRPRGGNKEEIGIACADLGQLDRAAA